MESGILAVNKPAGISSARVVARVKKKLNVKKVGHTGTLDPFATGLLLCAINKGTKISRFFLDGTKRYTARLCLGIQTDTHDIEGTVTATASQEQMDVLEVEKIPAIVQSFIGVQDQLPPIYSALKHNGTPLYKLARQGKAVQKPPRQIEIYSIDVLKIELPFVDIDVECSSGTYIRRLAVDIGDKLGCGAHLTQLCRTGSSRFRLEEAMELDVLEQMDVPDVFEKMISLSDCLDFLPKIVATSAMEKKVGFGQRLSNQDVNLDNLDDGQSLRVVNGEGDLLAVIAWDKSVYTYNYSCVFCS